MRSQDDSYSSRHSNPFEVKEIGVVIKITSVACFSCECDSVDESQNGESEERIALLTVSPCECMLERTQGDALMLHCTTDQTLDVFGSRERNVKSRDGEDPMQEESLLKRYLNNCCPPKLLNWSLGRNRTTCRHGEVM